MDNFIEIKNGILIIKYSKISTYTKKIRLECNETIIYEDSITDDYYFNYLTFRNGSVLKLYLYINEIWLFAETRILKLAVDSNILIDESQVAKFMSKFKQEVEELFIHVD